MTLSYKRNGAVLRDGIRIAWIERDDDSGMVCWTLRMTPASGHRFIGTYATRKDARYILQQKLGHAEKTP